MHHEAACHVKVDRAISSAASRGTAAGWKLAGIENDRLGLNVDRFLQVLLCRQLDFQALLERVQFVLIDETTPGLRAENAD